MSRETLFKAKPIDNCKWVEGYILHDGITGQAFIFPINNCCNESDKVHEEGLLHLFAVEVDPATICQYTGLTDKNGVKIFEHDIMQYNYYEEIINGTCEIGEYLQDGSGGEYPQTKCYGVYSKAVTKEYEYLRDYNLTHSLLSSFVENLKVIGNIFDNPELLKGKNDVIKTAKNISKANPVDEFECSECGVVLEGYSRVIIDDHDNDRSNQEYEHKFCPECGAKIVD